jgi:hypothetical protein
VFAASAAKSAPDGETLGFPAQTEEHFMYTHRVQLSAQGRKKNFLGSTASFARTLLRADARTRSSE